MTARVTARVGAGLAALAALAGLAALAAGPARAHDFNPGVLALQARDGAWDVAWTAPVDSRGAPAEVRVRWPAGCALDGPLDGALEGGRTRATLSCERGLVGALAFEGLHDPAMLVVVAVRDERGAREHLVRGASPVAELAAAPPGGLRAWVGVGVEHIVGGLDHLAFVLGLLLLLRPAPAGPLGGRASLGRLVATLTAFTLAHSVTLALAVLDVVALPSAPVEACIALSVLLVAREALRDEDTAMRRWPWLVAAVFGLVHGLGFAGALAEIGLPREALAASLLGFNAGVELGQLAVVVVALLAARAFGSITSPRTRERAHAATATALGALAAWWLIERALAIAGV